MVEQQFLTPKDVLGYAEEFIFLEEESPELYNFSLSNSLDDIKTAIYTRTGSDFDLDNAYWKLEPELSDDIKHLMNKHHIIYSMATWYEEKEKRRYLVVYMHVGKKWFYTRHNQEDGKIYNYEKYEIRRETIKRILKFLDDPSIDIDDCYFTKD